MTKRNEPLALTKKYELQLSTSTYHVFLESKI